MRSEEAAGRSMWLVGVRVSMSGAARPLWNVALRYIGCWFQSVRVDDVSKNLFLYMTYKE